MHRLSILICLALTAEVGVDGLAGAAEPAVAVVEGRVILPAVAAVQPRAQRGREYRNRQKRGRRQRQVASKSRPFTSVVVSAHDRDGKASPPPAEPVTMGQLAWSSSLASCR